MWATNPISFGTYLPPSHRRCISAQPRRSRLSTSTASSSPQPHPSQDVGGLGQAVLTALHSSSSSPLPQSTSKTLAATSTDLSKGNRNHSEQQKRQPREERELTGSEVLVALQKAGVRRSRSAKKGKNKERAAIGGGGQAAVDYASVRPLKIKSDWGLRLKELETRLQEFLNV